MNTIFASLAELLLKLQIKRSEHLTFGDNAQLAFSFPGIVTMF